MDVSFPIEKTCCFTGHRPQKLHETEENVKLALEREIDAAIESGFRVFITGMSTGVDLWAGEIVLRKRAEDPELRIIAALPYGNFGKHMSAVWRPVFREILSQAAQVVTMSEGYYRAVYQLRDEWMVDHSSRVIAVYNGEPGGTKNTMDYAEKKGVEIIRAI